MIFSVMFFMHSMWFIVAVTLCGLGDDDEEDTLFVMLADSKNACGVSQKK